MSSLLRTRCVPLVVGVVLVSPSLAWAAMDRSIWPWDPAWYGEVSIDLWTTLRQSPGAWWDAMLHAFGIKPPAIAWLGQFFVPLDGVFGSVEAALLFSIVLTQAASLMLIFAAGRRLADSLVLPALAGALLTASAPLFVALSHDYFVEPIQTLSVAWVLLIMVSARHWHPSLTVAQLVAAISLGLLAKLSTPLYMTAPAFVALVFSISALRNRVRFRWWLERRFVASALLATVLAYATASWYGVNFQSAWQQARYSAKSTLYGTERPFFSKLDFWFERFGDAIFLPYFDVALGLTLVVAAAALFTFKRRKYSLRGSAYPLLALLGCLGVPVAALISLAAQVNEDDRFLVPTIPAVGLALVAVLRFADARLAAWPLAALFAGQLAFTTLQSFDTATPSELAYYRLREPAARSAFAAQVDRIIRLTCPRETAARATMVGTDYPWLNHNTLRMLARARFQSGPRCNYNALGYAEADPEVGWRRLIESGALFFVTLDYGNPRNPLPADLRRQVKLNNAFNRINLAVLRRAIRSGRYTIVPQSRRLGLLVLRLAQETRS